MGRQISVNSFAEYVHSTKCNPGQIQLHIQLQLWLSLLIVILQMAAKSAFTTARRWFAVPFPLSHTHTHSISLSLSVSVSFSCLFAIINSRQSVVSVARLLPSSAQIIKCLSSNFIVTSPPFHTMLPLALSPLSLFAPPPSLSLSCSLTEFVYLFLAYKRNSPTCA